MVAYYTWDVGERFDSDVFDENLCGGIARTPQEPTSFPVTLLEKGGMLEPKLKGLWRITGMSHSGNCGGRPADFGLRWFESNHAH